MATQKKDKTIRSVGEFINCLHKTSTNKRRLFRGQNTDKPLLPRIMRLAKKNHIEPKDIEGVERKMLERFRNESVPILQETRKLADWELISIAQHWGMPTGLLDWTANPLAGLWFAVSANPHNEEDHGVVWVVEGPNEKTFKIDEDVFTLKNTCFFEPPHLDRRIVAQSGWFSVYRHNRQKFLPLERQRRYADKVTRFPSTSSPFFFSAPFSSFEGLIFGLAFCSFKRAISSFSAWICSCCIVLFTFGVTDRVSRTITMIKNG